MSDYPLTKALGVKLHATDGVSPVVLAQDLEAALAQAPVVRNQQGGMDHVWTKTDACAGEWSARLVCVAPIAKDTAESLLRELVEEVPLTFCDGRVLEKCDSIIIRARRLLESK